MRVTLDHAKLYNLARTSRISFPTTRATHQLLVCAALAEISPVVLINHLGTSERWPRHKPTTSTYSRTSLSTAPSTQYSWLKAKLISNSDKTVCYMKNFQPFMALIRLDYTPLLLEPGIKETFSEKVVSSLGQGPQNVSHARTTLSLMLSIGQRSPVCS